MSNWFAAAPGVVIVAGPTPPKLVLTVALVAAVGMGPIDPSVGPQLSPSNQFVGSIELFVGFQLRS